MLSLLVSAGLLFQSNAEPHRSQLAHQIAAHAEEQVGVTVKYDPSYQRIKFPNGDVALDRGACTDVVIRAYRAVGIDLQLLVNRDISHNWAAYPHKWGLTGPDTNIDHRRVPNLAAFFTRQGAALPVTQRASDYKAGDIVTWLLPGGQTHIGIVSSSQRWGTPLMVHNIGDGAQLENILFDFKITGHYRYLP